MFPLIAGLILVIVFQVLMMVCFIKAFYRKPAPGHRLVVRTMKSVPTITATGCTVLPILHAAHEVDMRPVSVDLDHLLARDDLGQALLQIRDDVTSIQAYSDRFGAQPLTEAAPELLGALRGALRRSREAVDLDAVMAKVADVLGPYGIELAGAARSRELSRATTPPT